jgi:AcrR family transcriptional regulator
VGASEGLTRKPGVWRGTTAEERVAPRRRKLIRAGFELLGEHGQEGTTVRGVCAKAHLNPRYFYESFDDLDELVKAVFDDLMAETTEVTLAAIAAAPDTAEAKTRAALDASIRHIAADPRRVHIAFEESAGVLGRRRAAVVKRTAQMMADQAASFFGIDRHDKLLISTTLMITGGISELVVAWSSGGIDLTVDELIDHATLMTLGASRAMGRPARRPASG